jgi:hypothetical protein
MRTSLLELARGPPLPVLRAAHQQRAVDAGEKRCCVKENKKKTNKSESS